MSSPKYRLSFEAIEGKWIIRELVTATITPGMIGTEWRPVAKRDTLEEAESTIRALACPPSEREYDADGNLVGVRVHL